MIKVGIVGIMGYAGQELLKILLRHNSVELVGLWDKLEKPKKISEIYPQFDLKMLVENATDESLFAEAADVYFLALPHGASAVYAHKIYQRNRLVIDFSADFRIKDKLIYEKYYGPHPCPELIEKAVYGLVEIYRKKIIGASLIANPGCYPTSVILGLAPLLKERLIDVQTIIVDSKSGVSGGGRAFVKKYYESEHPNLRPYNIAGTHRHIPEMEQELSGLAARDLKITFTPHIFPAERGMLSTIYAVLNKNVSGQQLLDIYRKFYYGEKFVQVLSDIPDVRRVVETNQCHLGVRIDEPTRRVIVVSAIDNLIKGAAGQAVQNLNIIFKIPEETALC